MSNNDVDFATSPAPFGNSRINALNTSGVLQNANTTMQISAGTGATNQGIIIGTGVTAVT
ncbi:MAG: hypothetical protein IPM51_12200, partial [Sphingobacteriaceae bacterium]|nr:hypothetical protein [Sphingobacteriaceae bacterium]